MRHVRAQLMGAARHRLEREPGELARRGLDHRVIGDRVARALLAMLGDAHERIVLALLLGEEGRDAALARLRHAGDQRPVDLARRARAEVLASAAAAKRVLATSRQPAVSLSSRCTSRGRWPSRGRAGPRACRRGGATVPEPPCTASPIGLLSTSTSASSYSVIDAGTRASCRRPRAARGGGARRAERRDAHRLAGLQPVLRLRALAVHAQLAFADDALDVGERRPGNRASRKRSTRMPASSAVTATVCTPVGIWRRRRRLRLDDGGARLGAARTAAGRGRPGASFCRPGRCGFAGFAPRPWRGSPFAAPRRIALRRFSLPLRLRRLIEISPAWAAYTASQAALHVPPDVYLCVNLGRYLLIKTAIWRRHRRRCAQRVKMSFFSNAAVNRLAVHSTVHQLALEPVGGLPRRLPAACRASRRRACCWSWPASWRCASCRVRSSCTQSPPAAAPHPHPRQPDLLPAGAGPCHRRRPRLGARPLRGVERAQRRLRLDHLPHAVRQRRRSREPRRPGRRPRCLLDAGQHGRTGGRRPPADAARPLGGLRPRRALSGSPRSSRCCGWPMSRCCGTRRIAFAPPVTAPRCS